FGWALWCCLALLPTFRSRIVRTLLVVYPILTLFAIVVTANHFWLDAVGGAWVLLLGYIIGTVITRIAAGVRARRVAHRAQMTTDSSSVVLRGGGGGGGGGGGLVGADRVLANRAGSLEAPDDGLSDLAGTVIPTPSSRKGSTTLMLLESINEPADLRALSPA